MTVQTSWVTTTLKRHSRKPPSLTTEQVHEITALRNEGMKMSALATQFNVDMSTISFAYHRKGTYANIPKERSSGN